MKGRTYQQRLWILYRATNNQQRPTGDEPGAAILMSVFFVKHGLIPVGAEQDVRHPFRGSSHLFTDGLQINSGAAFDDQFIVNVSDYEAVPEGLHCIAEDVAADCLDNVLYELRTVRFDAFPFLRGSDTFVGDGFTAELILTNTGLHI